MNGEEGMRVVQVVLTGNARGRITSWCIGLVASFFCDKSFGNRFGVLPW